MTKLAADWAVVVEHLSDLLCQHCLINGVARLTRHMDHPGENVLLVRPNSVTYVDFILDE